MHMIELWEGRISLPTAFWIYALCYGTMSNLFASGAALIILTTDLAAGWAVFAFLLPTPYYIVAAVGVWRSAENYREGEPWAKIAKIAVVIWTGLMIVI